MNKISFHYDKKYNLQNMNQSYQRGDDTLIKERKGNKFN